jgi:hypothetical protein
LATSALIPGDYFIDARCAGNRNKNPNKYKDDAAVLVRAFADAEGTLKTRYCFYCAQSYFDANMTDESIEWYERRINMGGFTQERYISCLRLGVLYDRKEMHLESIRWFLKSF